MFGLADCCKPLCYWLVSQRKWPLHSFPLQALITRRATCCRHLRSSHPILPKVCMLAAMMMRLVLVTRVLCSAMPRMRPTSVCHWLLCWPTSWTPRLLSCAVMEAWPGLVQILRPRCVESSAWLDIDDSVKDRHYPALAMELYCSVAKAHDIMIKISSAVETIQSDQTNIFKHKYHSFETLQYLIIRRLKRYWNGPRCFPGDFRAL